MEKLRCFKYEFVYIHIPAYRISNAPNAQSHLIVVYASNVANLLRIAYIFTFDCAVYVTFASQRKAQNSKVPMK